MDANTKQALRGAILQVMDANRSQYGLRLDGITMRLLPFGFPAITAAEVEAVMLLLEKEGMIAQLKERLLPGAILWRITDEGRNYVAENF